MTLTAALGLLAWTPTTASAGEPHDVNALAGQCISSTTALCPPGAPTIVSASPATPYGPVYGVSSNGTVYLGGKEAQALYFFQVSLNEPIVSMAVDPQSLWGSWLWVLGSDGGVFSMNGGGDPTPAAPYLGSMGGTALNAPMVGMASTPDGNGYWLAAADGGIFAFGDAGFFGSMGGHPLNAPIVGIAGTASGQGYWLVAKDGGVFAFGDAAFHGSVGGVGLNGPIVAIAADHSGLGYFLFGRDGGVFSFGDAPFLGSFIGASAPIVSGWDSGLVPEYYCVAASNGQPYCSPV
jgi:hypothetical protein